ncbi:MAG: NFYB/HAP3 family transcription factor subunit [Candidatus Micrarchaeaceae archaeon]
MTRILSADSMPKISKMLVKKLVKEKFGIAVSDDAAGIIASMLEEKATSIARYAVKRAQRKKRNTVLGEDIEGYKLKFGG